jgi:hypothetical protein
MSKRNENGTNRNGGVDIRFPAAAKSQHHN